jgi:integrase/recombinase XerD
MTPLRQRMTEDMQLRGLAPATQQAYLRYVEQLAPFTGKSPDLATDEDFRLFFLALHKQRGCSRSTATVAIAAFKFALSCWGRRLQGFAHGHGADYGHQCAACLSAGAYRRWRDQASLCALLAPFLGHPFA